MVTIVKNFNKEDCKHFKWIFSRGCCGRGSVKSGACAVPLDTKRVSNKVCSITTYYCKYEKREETS